MLIINTPAALARALDGPFDPAVKRLLALRWRQNGGDNTAARFIVATAHDSIEGIERSVGFPLLLHDDPDPPAPCWEWAERHDGGVWEAVFVFSDDGAAQVLIAFENDADTDLIELLHQHAACPEQGEQASAR